jgi:sodium/hydrogen antiporter
MSRTLSLRGRHEPEWATQTRKVTRPEDIVINRDHGSEPISATEKEMEEGRVGTSGSETDAAKAAEQAFDEEFEEKGELVRKWHEGRHLVIEHHRKEPGTEVG